MKHENLKKRIDGLPEEECNCDCPMRNYGEKVCLNCGKRLDFESEKIYLINKDGRGIEL